MPRFFNTAGPCRPEIHYTVDPLPRLSGIRELIDGQHYFVIHAPRQTGKTTYLYALMHALNREGCYTALQVNIQSAASGRHPQDAMRIAAMAMYDQALRFLPPAEQPPNPRPLDWTQEDGLRSYLTAWARTCPKPLVLFIDEADSLLDDLFLALLRQLRAGFEARPTHFPQSIALVGLRDVRDYKIRLRPDVASLGAGSPFNIKTKSLTFDNFSIAEVQDLLQQHTADTGQAFPPDVQQEIYRLSQGQPWLTNAIANQIVAEILHNDYSQPITLAHVTQAKEDLIERRDTHLDSLIDKLREDRVRPIIMAIMNGSTLESDRLNDDLAYIQDLGLITHQPPIRFANPIYAEIIPRVLSYAWQLSFNSDLVEPLWYIDNGKLDLDALLRAFQKFYRRHSEAWLEKYDFREVGRQLLLMAFLQRIINAGGQIEREMAVGNGRCDLVVDYGGERHLIELKLNRDQWSREDGLEQCARYASRLGLSEGHLVLFEIRAGIPWETRLKREEEQVDGTRIIVWGM